MAKFVRRQKLKNHRKNTEDAVGPVRIAVFMSDGHGGHKKGNITRSTTLDNTSVSDVFSAIEDALLGDDDTD